MNLMELIAALAPTFLKQEILVARNEHRAPNFEAVAEDSVIAAKALIKEYEAAITEGTNLHIINSGVRKSNCLPGFKRHLSNGKDGICIRCKKEFRTNYYLKKTS